LNLRTVLAPLAVSAALAGSAFAGAPASPCGAGQCFPGGGDAATDCIAEFEGVYANSPFPDPEVAPAPAKTEQRCFDGDAGCDLDGEPNGVCRFPVDVCVGITDPALPTCTAQTVTAATATAGKSKTLGRALEKLVAAGGTCTEGQTVDVKLTGKGKREAASVTVNVSATAGATTDTDALTLTCLPRVWPTQSYDPYNRRATRRTTIKPGKVKALTEKWTFPIAGNVTSTPTVSDTHVFATAWNGTIYAIDRQTGLEDWSVNFPGTSLKSSATLTADGRVLVGDSEANVHCLDAATGDDLWSRNVELLPQDHIWGSPVVVNNRVYVPIASDGDMPCTKGRLEALDLDTGAPLWTARTAPDRVCEDETTQGCAIDDDCGTGRCVGSCEGDHGLACVDDLECGGVGPDPGQNGPCVDVVGGGVTATPAASADGASIYMVSVGCFTAPRVGNSDRFFKLDAATGEIAWALPDYAGESFGSPDSYNDYGFLNGPIVVNGKKPMLIAASKDGKIYARDPATGAELWTNVVGDVTQVSDGFAAFGLFNGAPALAAKKLFASLNSFSDGSPATIVHTQSFKIAKGTHAWDASLDIGPTWGVVSVGGSVVYVGSSNLFTGVPKLYAFSAGNGKLIREFELPDQTSSGPAIVDDELFVGFGLALVGGGSGGVRVYELP
jgi:outer membrane protein assembly factor BamB